jgi:hypothetical protein
MSLSGVPIPKASSSSSLRQASLSPNLSRKSRSGRSPRTSAAVTSLTPLSAPLSPVLQAVASSVVLLAPSNLSLQQQQQQRQHVRSHSSPSLQHQVPPQPAQPIEYPITPINLSLDNGHSSSASNILAQQRENIFSSQSYMAYFPKSPRVMPLMSPGPVTPMQLEEDMDYRFPAVVTTSRYSPLVVPMCMTTGEEEADIEQYIEMAPRSR